MAYTNCTVPTNTISTIGTTVTERGLTTDQFKAKFDKFGVDFVAWFNATHLNELNTNAVASLTKVSNSLLTTITATSVATYTPAAQGNFLVGICYRVVTGITNVTLTVTYTDDTGAQTNTMLNAQASAIGSYSTVPLFINAKTTGAITVTATASVANQVYVSASIMGV